MRVGVMMMLSVAGPALAAAPTLDRIDVAGDEAPAVRLHLSAPVSATAHRLPAEGGAPARVYIDLSGAALGAALPHVLAGAAPVVRVRASQFDPTTVRIVVDLERRVPFVLRQMDETITLELEAPAPMAAAIEPPAPIPTAAAPVLAAPRLPHGRRGGRERRQRKRDAGGDQPGHHRGRTLRSTSAGWLRGPRSRRSLPVDALLPDGQDRTRPYASYRLRTCR